MVIFEVFIGKGNVGIMFLIILYLGSENIVSRNKKLYKFKFLKC